MKCPYLLSPQALRATCKLDMEVCGPGLKRAHKLLYDIRKLTQIQKFKHLGLSLNCHRFSLFP